MLHPTLPPTAGFPPTLATCSASFGVTLPAELAGASIISNEGLTSILPSYHRLSLALEMIVSRTNHQQDLIFIYLLSFTAHTM